MSESLYQKLVVAGAEIDNHCSDLYVKVTATVTEILQAAGVQAYLFRSNIDNDLWYDVPFAFDPYWKTRGIEPGKFQEALGGSPFATKV